MFAIWLIAGALALACVLVFIVDTLSWREVRRDSNCWVYLEHRRTGRRKAIRTSAVYSPVDAEWLRDGDLLVDQRGVWLVGSSTSAVFLGLFAWLFLGATAFAADTVAVPSDRIAVLPIYQMAEPYILTAFGAIFSALLAWALAQLQTRTGIKVTADARERIQMAATNAAGRILAAQEGNLAHVSFPAGSPVIAAQVPKIEAAAADAVKHLGLTPERIGDLIAGKIGQLQAGAIATAPAATPQTARSL